MLVLVRKPGQSIVVDGRTVITIKHVRGPRVKLHIDAPPEVEVRRGELPAEKPPEKAAKR